ncbi:hypothetical protein OPV22_011069 [Ensete ventricosum]|uniref:Uncharacterized protein n=1 Tax=Ensete ventricosum TaxID=4639 RepID=A0AAV8RI93_ENSVE|nr:hypothetical protein OPV22_011069 [Ensete ventricosum]
MSRHRRQASQSLPASFDITGEEEPPPKVAPEGAGHGNAASNDVHADGGKCVGGDAARKALPPGGSSSGVKSKEKPSAVAS